MSKEILEAPRQNDEPLNQPEQAGIKFADVFDDSTVKARGETATKPGSVSEDAQLDLSTDGLYPDKADGPEQVQLAQANFETENLADSAKNTESASVQLERGEGQRPTEALTLNEGADGRLSLTEANGEIKEFPEATETVQTDRAELMKAAEEHITNPEHLARFKANMIRFEDRAQESGISAEEVSDTYKAVSKLFQDNPDAPVSPELRTQLAQEVMGKAGTPETNDQGRHNTCNVKTIETRLYSKNPSTVANMVAEVALTGKFTTAQGETVNIPDSTFQPDPEAAKFPNDDGQRDFAGQIFDVTALNTAYNGKGYQFEQRQPSDSNPSGETMLDAKTGEELRFGGLVLGQVSDVYKQITGEEADFIVRAKQPFQMPFEGVQAFENTEQFKDFLTRAKQENNFPLVFAVDGYMSPISATGGADNPVGADGGHVVSITDYDPETGKVKIDNQWGSRNDRLDSEQQVSSDQAFYASLGSKGLETYLRNDARTQHPDSPSREQFSFATRYYDAVRGSSLTHDYGEFFAGGEVGKAILDPNLGSEEKGTANALFESMSPSGQLGVLKTFAQSGLPEGMTEEQFITRVADATTNSGITREQLSGDFDKLPDQYRSFLWSFSQERREALLKTMGQ